MTTAATTLESPTPSGLETPAGHHSADRIAWLFRHSLRAGEVHPALHLVQQYRSLPGVLAILLPPAPTPSRPIAHAAVDPAMLDRGVGELPALPQVVLELMTMLQDDSINSADFAARIESDQGLVARTLRLANSPFYGVCGRVGTIRDAVQMLGMRAVGTLLTTASVSGRISAAECADFDFPGFWRHALATGIAARELARCVRLNDDLAFVAGLLHDIGRLVLAARLPRALALVIESAHDADIPELDAEQQVLGCSHTDVGTRVARHWHFPAAVVDAIEHHHRPGALSGAAPTISDLVHVADALAHGLDLMEAERESVPPAEPAAWSRLRITDAQYMAVLAQTEEGVAALCEALAL